MVVLTSRQPVAALTTTGSLVPMSTWRTTMGAPQPAHMRWPPASWLPCATSSSHLRRASSKWLVSLRASTGHTSTHSLHRMQRLSSTRKELKARSLKVSAPVGQAVTQRPQADAVGQLQGFAVGRVDVHGEAAPGEVIAGGAGHVAADPHAPAAGDAALHGAPDEGMLVLRLDHSHPAGLGDQFVGGEAVLHAQLSAGRRSPGWGTRTAGSASPLPGRRRG